MLCLGGYGLFTVLTAMALLSSAARAFGVGAPRRAVTHLFGSVWVPVSVSLLAGGIAGTLVDDALFGSFVGACVVLSVSSVLSAVARFLSPGLGRRQNFSEGGAERTTIV